MLLKNSYNNKNKSTPPPAMPLVGMRWPPDQSSQVHTLHMFPLCCDPGQAVDSGPGGVRT